MQIQSLGWKDPPQYSCLKNSRDRGAWLTTAHGVTELHMTEGLTLLFLGELYSALCNVFNVAYCSFFQFYSYLSKGEKFGQLEIGCFIQSILTENLRIHICLSSFWQSFKVGIGVLILQMNKGNSGPSHSMATVTRQVHSRGEFLAPSTTSVCTSHNWEQNPNTEGKQSSEHSESFDIWNRLEKTENCPYLSWAGFAMVTDCLIGSYVSFHFRIWSCSVVHNYLDPSRAGIWGHLHTVLLRWVPAGEWSGFLCDMKSLKAPYLLYLHTRNVLACLENPMDRGPCLARVHGMAKSWIQRSDWAGSSHLFANSNKGFTS